MALGSVAGSSACTTTTTVNTSLVSGIFLNTSLLLNGLGCSATSTQDVYKYVAVVINDTRDIGGAGLFDCFADGAFADLPGSDAGPLNFAVWVFAYNKADYDVANADGAIAAAVGQLNGVYQPDGSVIPVPITVVPDGGTATRGFPAALSTLCLRHATWVSTCSAVTQVGVQTLADCRPLALEDGTPSACTLPVLLPDATAGH